MLELSHEVNSAMQGLSVRIQDVCEEVQAAASSIAQRVTSLKVMRSTMTSKCADSPIATFGSTTHLHASLSGAGQSASTDTLKMAEEFQATLRSVQRAVLLMATSYETYTATLQHDFKKKSQSVHSGPINIVFPSARQVPFPLSQASTAHGERPVSQHLPSIVEGNERSSRCGLAALCQTPLPGKNSVTQKLEPPSGGASCARSPREVGQSTAKPQPSLHTPATSRQRTQKNVVDKSSHDTIASAFYFSFDALCRCLRAYEAVAYVQRTPDEAQGVCVFGPKPRHPSAVTVSLRSGLVGAVMKSGIALNVATEATPVTPLNSHAMCLPIFESSDRRSPIGALHITRVESAPFSESEVALGQLWTVMAAQFLLGYGVDLVADPYDPLQSIFRSGSAVLELMGSKRKDIVPSPPSGGPPPGFESFFQEVQNLNHSNCASQARSDSAAFVVDMLSAAQYNERLASLIATQVPPQLVLQTSHRNHGANFRPSELKGQTEILRYRNLMDVAAYIQRLDDSWRRSTSDLQGMEREQISQLQDMKQGLRKLKSVSLKLDTTAKEAQTYREKYEVLKKELASLAAE